MPEHVAFIDGDLFLSLVKLVIICLFEKPADARTITVVQSINSVIGIQGALLKVSKKEYLSRETTGAFPKLVKLTEF